MAGCCNDAGGQARLTDGTGTDSPGPAAPERPPGWTVPGHLLPSRTEETCFT